MTESVLKSKKLYENILALLSGKCGLENGYNFLGKGENKTEKSLLLTLKHRYRKEVGHFSDQCIQTKIMWLPTLRLGIKTIRSHLIWIYTVFQRRYQAFKS